jgi:hypothetical protein
LARYAGYWYYFIHFREVVLDLDKLQFNAIVRSGWQAIDLGFLMASTWWRQLFVVGALPPILLFLPLLILFSDHPFWAAFIIWWLKPFWERLPLFFGSRRVFGEESGPAEILWQTRSIYLKDAIPWLLWRRFSFQRAFDAPVTVLEGLTGKTRSSRLNVLHGKYSDIALGNQLICFCFELIFCFGIAAIILFFVPDDFSFKVFDRVEELTLAGQWLYIVCWFIAMILIMPFHSMAGFALYLNRRIELEAWDIEITFRNLANRKQQSTHNVVQLMSAALLAILITIGTPSPSNAEVNHDNASANQLIEEVLQGEDFGQEITVRKWRFKNLIEENEDKIPEWLINFIEWLEKNVKFGDESNDGNFLLTAAAWLKVLLVALAVLLFVYLFYRFRGPLHRLKRSGKTESTPDVLFGLDVRPESLPDDIPAQVMAFWRDNRHRDALGLLYRASLSGLIEQHALAFKSSHTEAECAALVKARGIESLSRYFAGLTRVWCHLAYGHELPAIEAIEELCEGWSSEMVHEL